MIKKSTFYFLFSFFLYGFFLVSNAFADVCKICGHETDQLCAKCVGVYICPTCQPKKAERAEGHPKDECRQFSRQKHLSGRVEIRPSLIPGAGRGIFVKEPVAKGDPILVYGGEALRLKDCGRSFEEQASVRGLAYNRYMSGFKGEKILQGSGHTGCLAPHLCGDLCNDNYLPQNEYEALRKLDFNSGPRLITEALIAFFRAYIKQSQTIAAAVGHQEKDGSLLLVARNTCHADEEIYNVYGPGYWLAPFTVVGELMGSPQESWLVRRGISRYIEGLFANQNDRRQVLAFGKTPEELLPGVFMREGNCKDLFAMFLGAPPIWKSLARLVALFRLSEVDIIDSFGPEDEQKKEEFIASLTADLQRLSALPHQDFFDPVTGLKDCHPEAIFIFLKHFLDPKFTKFSEMGLCPPFLFRMIKKEGEGYANIEPADLGLFFGLAPSLRERFRIALTSTLLGIKSGSFASESGEVLTRRLLRSLEGPGGPIDISSILAGLKKLGKGKGTGKDLSQGYEDFARRNGLWTPPPNGACFWYALAYALGHVEDVESFAKYLHGRAAQWVHQNLLAGGLNPADVELAPDFQIFTTFAEGAMIAAALEVIQELEITGLDIQLWTDDGAAGAVQQVGAAGHTLTLHLYGNHYLAPAQAEAAIGAAVGADLPPPFPVDAVPDSAAADPLPPAPAVADPVVSAAPQASPDIAHPNESGSPDSLLRE